MTQLIIFILGYQGSGKSSIIRALTGSRQIELRDLRSIDGRLLPVLVNLRSPQERGCEDHPPDSFPESIETLAGVSRDVWDVLVSALQYAPQIWSVNAVIIVHPWRKRRYLPDSDQSMLKISHAVFFFVLSGF